MRRKSSFSLALLGALVLGALAPSCEAEPDYQCNDSDSQALFARKIQPLLVDDAATSCNQCHLKGVNLAAFARDTPCETMACLDELGLVDLETPSRSLVLRWIERAKAGSPLSPTAANLEYDAFRSFVEYHSRCGQEVCAGVVCTQGGAPDACAATREPPAFEVDDPGGCSDRAIEQLFTDTVYKWRGRCYPCHFDNTKQEGEAPKWIRTEGGCDVASLATLREIEDARYIRTDNPAASTLLLKPLAEEAGGVEHGGHTKFKDQDDQAYQAFRHFIERYSDCKGSR